MDRQNVNIQHILASLALKATRQSVIIAKLSSYPRKNRTKKALWELDNLRALNRGEFYHKLVRAAAYANGGKLRVRTDQEQQLWSECSRLLANCIIYYNACILSELLERAERRQDYQRADAIKRANPANWKHVNLYGAYSFLDIGDGSTSRNWSISWRQPAVGAPRRRTEVYFLTQIDFSRF